VRRYSRSFGAVALLLILSVPRGARCEDAKAPSNAELPPAPKSDLDRVEKARALFKEGRTLAQKGDWDGACARFQSSLDLEPGVGTQFNLADCLEHRGRTASARSLFLEVAERARVASQGDRERVARARAAQLEGRVPSLVIDVAYPSREQEVRRDGVLLPAAAWSSALSIDPGASVISASAPGKETWSTRIDVPANGALITVLVPRLADAKAPPPVAAAPVAKAAVVAKPAPPAPPPEVAPEPKKKSNVLPIVLLAAAGAGTVVGATGLILYKRSNDEAEAICPSSVSCSPADLQRHDELTDDARAMRTIGFIGFGVAGAALITTGVLALTGRSSSEKPPSAPVAASAFVGPQGFSAGLAGRF
jgi:hypothetical protein